MSCCWRSLFCRPEGAALLECACGKHYPPHCANSGVQRVFMIDHESHTCGQCDSAAVAAVTASLAAAAPQANALPMRSASVPERPAAAGAHSAAPASKCKCPLPHNRPPTFPLSLLVEEDKQSGGTPQQLASVLLLKLADGARFDLSLTCDVLGCGRVDKLSSLSLCACCASTVLCGLCAGNTPSPLLNKINEELERSPICSGCFRAFVSTLPVLGAKTDECEKQAAELESAHALALDARDARAGRMYVTRVAEIAALRAAQQAGEAAALRAAPPDPAAPSLPPSLTAEPASALESEPAAPTPAPAAAQGEVNDEPAPAPVPVPFILADKEEPEAPSPRPAPASPAADGAPESVNPPPSAQHATPGAADRSLLEVAVGDLVWHTNMLTIGVVLSVTREEGGQSVRVGWGADYDNFVWTHHTSEGQYTLTGGGSDSVVRLDSLPIGITSGPTVRWLCLFKKIRRATPLTHGCRQRPRFMELRRSSVLSAHGRRQQFAATQSACPTGQGLVSNWETAAAFWPAMSSPALTPPRRFHTLDR